jgi:Patatin-like phospholipase
MAEDTQPQGAFEIGLVLAGAVSAGAYTAGVIDFLFEALEEWEKKRGQPGIAPHRVRIKVMAGTSAGAITSAIAASSVRIGSTPVRSIAPVSAPDNKLYSCWVEQADIVPMLRNDDLSYGTRVASVLNSKALDRIADSAMDVTYAGRPWPAYLSDPLQIYLCTTNLRGVPYTLQLTGGDQGYGMSLHADYSRFSLSATGRTAADALPLPFTGSGGNWDYLKTAALASGAFPIGLAARTLKRPARQYNQRAWYISAPGSADGVPVVEEREIDIEPSWPLAVRDDPAGYDFEYVNVDGGVINNEPLEIARRALAGEQGRNSRDPDKATRAVLMVDPFPNEVALDTNYRAQDRAPMLSVATDLVSAMLYQMRFKLEELALARDEGVFSRFVISPSRWVSADGKPENAQRADYALACGALGGFAGFLSREFRHHDYCLGRINCQRFLQEHFVLDAANPVFSAWSAELKQQHSSRQTYVTRRAGKDERQTIDAIPIIPLVGRAAEPAVDGGHLALRWPRGKAPSRKTLDDALMERVRSLVNHFLETEMQSKLIRRYVRATWGGYRLIKWITRDSPVKPLLDAIEADLIKRGLA